MNKPPKVLITGATSGIGLELTRRYLKLGCKLVILVRKKDLNRDIIQEFEQNTQIELVELDLTQRLDDSNQLEEDLGDALKDPVDIAILNAGIGLYGPLTSLSLEQIEQQFAVNTFAPFMLTQFLLQLSVRPKKIIYIGSIVGKFATPLASAYCASKFALEGMFDSLYLEAKSLGVQICKVRPGRFKTQFVDNLKWGEQTDQRFEVAMEEYKKKLRASGKFSRPLPVKMASKLVQKSLKKKLPKEINFGLDSKLLIAFEIFWGPWLSRFFLDFAFFRSYRFDQVKKLLPKDRQ